MKSASRIRRFPSAQDGLRAMAERAPQAEALAVSWMEWVRPLATRVYGLRRKRFFRNEFQPFGASADNAAPNKAEGWRRDNPEHRETFRQKRDIDGVLVAAGNKFLGAVERIDEIVTIGFGREGRTFRRFFGHDREGTAETRQTVRDDRFRRLICRGYRGTIRLSADAPAKRSPDSVGRGNTDLGERVQRIGIVGWV